MYNDLDYINNKINNINEILCNLDIDQLIYYYFILMIKGNSVFSHNRHIYIAYIIEGIKEYKI